MKLAGARVRAPQIVRQQLSHMMQKHDLTGAFESFARVRHGLALTDGWTRRPAGRGHSPWAVRAVATERVLFNGGLGEDGMIHAIHGFLRDIHRDDALVTALGQPEAADYLFGVRSAASVGAFLDPQTLAEDMFGMVLTMDDHS
jgi:hypothetical protein